MKPVVHNRRVKLLALALLWPIASVMAQTTEFVPRQATFTGNTVITSDVLQATAAPYLSRPLNHPLTEDDLEDLRQKLVRVYTDAGYVNSGVVVDGVLAGNTLNFKVIEGRLKGITVTGAGRLDPRYVTRRLDKDDGAPFNTNVLRERFQLLLTDPLMARMNARVAPGEILGEALLEVDVALAPNSQFTLLANNYHPPSVGEASVGVAATFRNLTGAGDLLEANLQAAPQSGILSKASLAWQVPLGFSGTRMSLGIDQGDSSVMEQPAAVLGITSQLRSVDLGLSHAFVESLTHRFTLGLNRVVRENQTSLLGTPFSFNPNEPDGLTRETLWRVWQDYSYRTPTQALAFRSTFTFGQNNLRDSSGLPAQPNDGAPPSSPPSSFRSWMGQAQWSRQLSTEGVQLVARAIVQRSADRLLALDGLAVGGVNTVRGYRENELVRDQGEYINLEVDFPVAGLSGSDTRVHLVPFIDAGSAHNLGGPIQALSSLGLAVRAYCRGLQADLTIAKRLTSVDQSQDSANSLQGQGIHLQISYKF